jgi:DNA-binding NarL/FixJ family response regulator
MQALLGILIVDDHPLVAEALAERVGRAAGLQLRGIARTVDEADRSLSDDAGVDDPIDVVVCDIQLAGRAEGLDLLARHVGGPRFLMLTSFDQPALVRRAFDLGAAGYLPKTATVDEIVEAVMVVAAGGTAYPDSSKRALDAAMRHPSQRELGVIALVAEGLSNDEIGARLGLSSKTIESHLHRMFDRYGVFTRTELVMTAIRQGWLSGEGVPVDD